MPGAPARHKPLARTLAAALGSTGLLACLPATPTGILQQPPACPRDAAAASGACACARDRVPLLGACVEAAVRDAYCGPAALAGAPPPCRFRTCAPREALDEGGRCIPIGSVARAGPACQAPATLVVTADGHAACVPADAACPRGTFATGATCRAPPSCPPGSLWTGHDCRPVVTAGPRGPVVDLGAWTALALGPSGGPGSPDLCRPLQAAPLAFDLGPAAHVDVTLAITLQVPDQDLSRVFASVQARGEPGHPLPAPAADLAARSLATLVEALRGLGGDSSTGAVQVEVRCSVASL